MVKRIKSKKYTGVYYRDMVNGDRAFEFTYKDLEGKKKWIKVGLESHLASEIKEIQTMKKSLESAKETALEAVASVFLEYGVDRIEGTMISSLTITPSKAKIKNTLTILDANALISLGYVNVTIDEKSIMEAMCTIDGMEEIDQYVEITVTEENTPARLKVNAKRTSANNQATELLSLVDSQVA